MPPRDSNRRLSEREIELIGRWIDQGANWEQHWSFRPLIAPEIPDTPAFPDTPVHNPIDAFVQRELAKLEMRPAAEANRAILIRRLSLDLTGLPPTPEQVDKDVYINYSTQTGAA